MDPGPDVGESGGLVGVAEMASGKLSTEICFLSFG